MAELFVSPCMMVSLSLIAIGGISLFAAVGGFKKIKKFIIPGSMMLCAGICYVAFAVDITMVPCGSNQAMSSSPAIEMAATEVRKFTCGG